MKKVCIISVLIILSIVSIVGTAYAASAKVTMKSSVNECKKDEVVTFEVRLSNIDSEKGIIALGGTLVYNKDELEFKGISNAENWSTSYNSNNGKFIADRSDRTKDSEAVFNINFKVIAEEKNNVNVTLSDLEASGGNGAIKISDASASVDIKATEQKPENTDNPENIDTPDNTDTPENTDKPENPVKPEGTVKPTNTANPESTTKPENIDTPANNTVEEENENTNTTNLVGDNTTSLDKNSENIATSSIPKAGSTMSTPIIIGLIFLTIVGFLSIYLYLKFSKSNK